MLSVEQEESSRKHLAKQHSFSSLNPNINGVGSNTGGNNPRRSATLTDNESLRVVINCLYHLVEAIRRTELIFEILEFCKRCNESNKNYNFTTNLNSSIIYTEERLRGLRDNFIIELGICYIFFLFVY